MNKTRKNKYLRKNRHGKNSKHKHKTRKVQRGGKAEALGVINADAGVRVAPPLPNRPEFLKRPPPPTAAQPQTPAAPVEARQVQPLPEQFGQFGQGGRYRQQYNTGHGFGGSMNDTAAAVTTASTPPPDTVTTASHTGNDKKPTNESQSDAAIAKMQQDAIDLSKTKENPSVLFPTLLEKTEAYVVNKFTPGNSDVMTELNEIERLHKLSQINAVQNDGIKEQIQYYTTENQKILIELNNPSINNDGKKKDLETQMNNNNIQIGHLQAALGDNQRETLGAYNSDHTMMMSTGQGMGMNGNSVTRGTPPGTSQAIDGNTSKQPGFFKRMGNKISGSFTRKKPTPEEEAKQKTIEEGRQQHREEQKALDNANRLKRVKTGLIPTFTRGVKEKFSNAGQAVKTGVSYMGQAVKTKFGNATQKFSKNNSKNDSEKLLSNSDRSDDTANTEQKKSFRERLVNMKQSASARFTRKNRGTENPESEKTGLLSNDKKIEMQNIEPTPLPSQPTTPAAPGAAPPRPPPPPERPEELKRAIETRKAAAAPAETPTPPPVPSRPTSFSALSQQATVPPSFYNPTRPMVNIKQTTPTQSTDLITLGGGGNKTRKNQQYIHEIKDNRTHLFNKEMEILNSIRNFKNGHNKDSKKQFMKAVKRG